MKIFKNLIVQFILFGALLTSIGLGLLYFKQDVERPDNIAASQDQLEGIVNFSYDRDHDFINSVFKDDQNWYWLVEGTRNDFSSEDMMQLLTTSRDPRTAGQLKLKMLYADDKPVGFLAYYMKNFYQGKIRFVYVDSAYRGKGYGLKMVEYAVDELKSLGAAQIKLTTRSGNLPAQRIYEKAGFEVVYAPEGFVYYVKNLG